MKASFNLATPKNRVSSIRLIVTHRGKVYRKAVGLSCPVKDWSSSKQRCGHTDIDKRLKEIKLYLDSHLDAMSTEQEVLDAIGMALLPEDERETMVRPGVPTFIEILHEKCFQFRSGQSMYRRIVGIMGTKDNWKDIDLKWYDRLVGRLEDEEASANTIGSAITYVKAAMNRGFMLGYHQNMTYKMFKAPHEETFAVYLSREEIETLWKADLPEPIASARDLFMLGVYTAARKSDYMRLTEDNIRDGMIEFIQKKTGRRVTIPCSPRVREIFGRHGGCAPKMAYETFLQRIKEACRQAGITQVVQVPNELRRRLRKAQNEPVYKWELVASHTARRTGATLLYMTGVPITQCRMITGHKTESSFLKYIRVTGEENARLLADNPFFK